LVCTVAIIALNSCLYAAAGPVLSVSQVKQDLGRILRGDKAVGNFAVANPGDARLELSLGAVSCDCAVARVDPFVEPGREGAVHIEIDTTAQAGALQVTVELLSNDPARPKQTLSLNVLVGPRIEADPGFARFLYVQGEPGGTLTQRLWSNEEREFKIAKVETPYPFLVGSFREAGAEERKTGLGAGKQWLVAVTLSPPAVVGALRGTIKIHTDHPQERVVEIPLSGFVRPTIALTPENADFGKLTVGSRIRSPLIVANYATEEISVERAEVNNPVFEVRLVPTKAGRRYRLDVIAAPKEPGVASGIISLYTNSPKTPRIDIPVRVEAIPKQ
jgi:hypothetical protein